MNDIEKRDDYIALKNNIQQAVKESRAVIILDESHVDKAGFYLKNFRKIGKSLESFKKEVNEPHKAEIKKNNLIIDNLWGICSPEEERLNNELQDFITEQKQKQEEQRQKEQREMEDSIISEAEIFDDESVLDNIPQVEFKQTGLGDISSSVTTMRIKKWKVTDFDKIDRKYLIVDEALMTRLRKEADFETQSPIEGIEYYFTETVRSK